ncbi:alpha-crystallin A chain [Nilaparvata lugens]|uniref:alpha-crystallin A chain n=1 Tax=Nilaparvata lugens TaxID=108931 RepID=UPI000B98E79C|nr:alpha-crystallin A chain [Nilaparvata lugens]
MSLLPYVMRDFVDDFYQPAFFGDHFGLRPSTVLSSVPLQAGYLRPWRLLESQDSGISNIEEDPDNFKVNLDVQQFKPEEISVKLSDDNIVIEGKHEERKDQHGFISRQFCRRYKLPENVDLQRLESRLSSDGVLQLIAPKIIDDSVSNNERRIPIKHTNQPAIKHKQPSSNEKQQSKENMQP